MDGSADLGGSPMGLKDNYEDPDEEGALGGVRPFARAHGLKDKQAKDILPGVLSYTLHKPRRKRFPTLPTLVFGIDEQWQMDLVDMQKLSKWNKGVKYLLTVIDVFSKRAWAEPIKNKSGKEMVKALNRMEKVLAPHRPLRVQTDDGKEFFNKQVQAWFKSRGYHHFSTKGDQKAAVLERWHRTLKERMFRAFTAKNTLSYLEMLPKLIHTYNRTPHSTIGVAPIDVTSKNERDVWDRVYGKRLAMSKKKARLKEGDRVRLNKKHRPFKKGYLPGWTEEVFLVTHVRETPLPAYRVTEWDGTPIKGTFYAEDLQKVDVDDTTLFRVEKVLKRSKGQLLVRWKGWPKKYDSWISAKDYDGPKKRNTQTKTTRARRTKLVGNV